MGKRDITTNLPSAKRKAAYQVDPVELVVIGIDTIKDHTDELMAIPGVVAVAMGESGGKPCLRVFVTDASARSLGDIPDDIEGYGVLITKSGKFQARKKL